MISKILEAAEKDWNDDRTGSGVEPGDGQP